ncbi:hypothetical protein RUND412_008394, partial [Rhizina undulata]
MLLSLSILTLLGAFSLITDGRVDAAYRHHRQKSIKKSAVTGFFAQDLAETNDATFDF